MPKFIANEAFEFAGMIRRENSTLTVEKPLLLAEIAKGVHPVTGKPLSGLLNHCSPADDETEALVEGLCAPVEKDEPSEEETAARIAEIKEELESMGKAFDNRWGLKRFENELIKAKKETGE